MNFDRNSLQKLLQLPDSELSAVISEIAAEAGVDKQGFSISRADIAKLRAFLSIASNEQIAELLSQFGGKRNVGNN